MKVLLTGATGFIGRHVVPALLDRGHDVSVLVRRAERLAPFGWAGTVGITVGDIEGVREGADAFRGADVLMHLAWSGLPRYDELFHFEENLPAQYRFLKAAVTSGVGRVLVTGTCLEYGVQDGCLFEDMPSARLGSAYAIAKDTLRRYLQALQRERSFVLQWARLFYTYGPGQNPGSLLARLDRALEAGEATFGMSHGEQLRDYLPVESVAGMLTALLETPACTGIVNVCSGTPTSVRRLVEEHLARRGGTIRLSLGEHPVPAHEAMAFWGDTTKFRSLVDGR